MLSFIHALDPFQWLALAVLALLVVVVRESRHQRAHCRYLIEVTDRLDFLTERAGLNDQDFGDWLCARAGHNHDVDNA